MTATKPGMVDVVHIGYYTGPKGGEYWRLKLACGHIKHVPMPKFRLSDICKPIRFAPYKCKCVICHELAQIDAR